jgi:hypothetical protein
VSDALAAVLVEVAQLRVHMEAVAGAVAELTLAVRGLRADQARRRAPSSRDDRDAVLLLVVADMFGAHTIQVVDVMARAVESAELRHLLECAGAGSGRKLGHWFGRLQNREIHGIHVIRLGHNNKGAIWRVLRD